MLIYGRHPVREALRAGIVPKVVYVGDGTKLDEDIKWMLAEENVTIRSLPRFQFENMLNAHGITEGHQGVAADIGEFYQIHQTSLVHSGKRFKKLPSSTIASGSFLLVTVRDPNL